MWPFTRPRPKHTIYVPPPESPEAGIARIALAKAPGPSPWYLAGHRDVRPIIGSRGPLQWEAEPNNPKHAGKTFLRAPNGALVAVCDFLCYVRPMANARFVVWATEQSGQGPDFVSTVRLQVYDADSLSEVTSVDMAIASLGPARRFFAATTPIADVALPTTFQDGRHSVDLPVALRGEGELLILATSTADGRRENHFDQMHLRLWLLNTSTGSLDIVPQDWFNAGPYDFGYQWVTRVARETPNGPIYGEGIRLGIFRLDASLRQVDAWLAQDTFFHPER